MVRRIHCEECDRKTRPQHHEDVALGWKRRRLEIRAKKPEEHSVIIVAGSQISRQILSTLHCDMCNVALPDGTRAIALTEWNTNREGEPGPWEQDYFQLI